MSFLLSCARRSLTLAIAASLVSVIAAPSFAQTAPVKKAKAKKPRLAKEASQASQHHQRDDVRAFIDEMVAKHGMKKEELLFLFSRTRFDPKIVKLITPPSAPRARSWANYRRSHVDDLRVQGGIALLQRYPAELVRAEKEYGVPPEIIAAIIGVETVYGRVMGDFRVIDALTTLAFHYPRRADYFRSELEQFLLLARELDKDVFEPKGSYAGAIGIPQFMPGSWRRWAVDFDGDGKIDLRGSFVDAIGSVASFLKAHGWQAGQPVAVPVQVSGELIQGLIDEGIEPKRKLAELITAGVNAPKTEAWSQSSAALIDLVTPDQPTEYLVGFNNFYVITRYNRSSFYATSVWQLAQMVKAGR